LRRSTSIVTGGSAGAGWVVAFIVLSIAGLCAWLVMRIFIRRRKGMNMRMLGPDTTLPSSTAASYVPSEYIPAAYNAPIAIPSPLVGDAVTSSTACGSTDEPATRNQGALARARAANSPPASGYSRHVDLPPAVSNAV